MDAMIWKLSQKITRTDELRSLAIYGLKIEDPTINKNLHNEKDISEAAYQVLRQWRTSQTNDKVAYMNLCEALKDEDVNMEGHIQNVLEVMWKKKMSKAQ